MYEDDKYFMDLKEASLYWIRLSSHTDPLTEGYIGVSKNSDQRMRDHKYRIIKKTHINPHLINAAEKYGLENLIKDVILSGDEKFCYQIEAEYRPNRNIGWNVAPGGQKGPGKFNPNDQLILTEKRAIKQNELKLRQQQYAIEHKKIFEQKRTELAKHISTWSAEEKLSEFQKNKKITKHLKKIISLEQELMDELSKIDSSSFDIVTKYNSLVRVCELKSQIIRVRSWVK
jgi:hypothetical protein